MSVSTTNCTLESRMTLTQMEYAFLSVYIAFVGLFGVLGNSLVIHIFRAQKTLRTSTNAFICYLSVCNLFLAIMDLIFSLPSALSHRWIYGEKVCDIYGWFYNYLCAMSLNTLAAISLDRYWVVTKPSIDVKITIGRAKFLIFLTCLYTFLPTTPIFLAGDFFREGMFHSGCYVDLRGKHTLCLLYAVLFAVFLFFIPFATMVVCYYTIYTSVRQRRHYCSVSTRKKRGAKFLFFSTTHLRTVRMIAVVVVVFLCCWFPYVAVSLAMTHGNYLRISNMTLEITILLAKSAVVCNPIIYAALNQRFRKAFFTQLLCRKFMRKLSQRDKLATSHTNRDSTRRSSRSQSRKNKPETKKCNSRSRKGSFIESKSGTIEQTAVIRAKKYLAPQAFKREDTSRRCSCRSSDPRTITTQSVRESFLLDCVTHDETTPTTARFVTKTGDIGYVNGSSRDNPGVNIFVDSPEEAAICENKSRHSNENVTVAQYEELQFINLSKVRYKTPLHRTCSEPVKHVTYEVDKLLKLRRGSVLN